MSNGSLSTAYLWNREIYDGVCLWLFLNMVPLRNAIKWKYIVYRKSKMAAVGGPKKGNALSLMVILEVEHCLHQISRYTLHRDTIPTTMSMSVSRWVECHWYLQGGPKIAPFLYALTSSNTDFLNYFTVMNEEKICNNTITTDPTTP